MYITIITITVYYVYYYNYHYLIWVSYVFVYLCNLGNLSNSQRFASRNPYQRLLLSPATLRNISLHLPGELHVVPRSVLQMSPPKLLESQAKMTTIG